jgi:O-antigen ligase
MTSASITSLASVPRRAAAPLFRRPLAAPRAPLAYHALRLFLVLLYANLPLWIPAAEVLHPAQIAAAAALGLLAVEGVMGRVRLGLVWPEGYLLLAFLTACTLSSFVALWPGLAFRTTLDLVKCGAAYLLLSVTIEQLPRLRGALWTMVLAGLFPAVGTLVAFATGATHEGRAGWLGAFANPNDLAYSLVILLPLAYVVGTLSGWGGRVIAGLILATYSAAIYTTFSRGGLMGFFAVLLVVVLRLRSGWVRTAALTLMIAVALVVGLFWQRHEGFAELTSDATVNQRLITLKAGLEMFADRPVLGVGPGCSVIAFETYAPYSYLTYKSLIVHNTVVQALAEVGMLGAIPYLLLMTAGIWGAHRLARRRPGASRSEEELALIAGALQASLVGCLICGLSGGYVLSWFPFILVGLVSATRRVAALLPSAPVAEAA